MLLAALTALFLSIGYSIGGRGGLVFAAFVALIMNFASYWWSYKIVLRTYGAREVTADQAPELFAIVPDDGDDLGYPCRVVWRSGNRMGIKFE